MALLTLLLSLFSFPTYAKTIKVYCKADETQAASFTLVASLEVDERNNNRVMTDVLVAFKDDNTQEPEQIIKTTGYYRPIDELKGHSYLFPKYIRSEIVHFILRLNADATQKSEVETTDNKKYASNCITVE